MKKFYFIAFLFCLIFLILFAGCLKPDPPDPEFNNIIGIVHTDGDNEGILHFHYKNDGVIFGQTSVCKRGGFLIKKDETFANDFIAHADVLYDDLECRYSAEIKSLESNQPIYIGPVSTLIYNYHLLNPGYSYSECRKDVLEFLNVDPTLSDLTIFIRKSVFSNEKFMEYAKGFGNFDEFINFLMGQIIGGTTHYEFKEEESFPTKEYLEQVTTDLAENLDIPGGSCLTGWVIDTIGGGGPPDPLKPIEKLLEEQTKMLEQIISMIQNLENEISSLENEMEEILAETNYNILVGQLNEPIGKIKSYYETLHTYSTFEATTTNKEEMDDFRRAIVKDVQPAFEQIYLTLNGSAGAESLLSIWSRVAFMDSGDMDDYEDRIKSQITYYIGYLLKATGLTVEGYHEYDPPDITMARSNYYSNLDEIQDLLDQYDDYNPLTTVAATTALDHNVLDIFLGEKYLYALVVTGGTAESKEIDVLNPIDLSVVEKIIIDQGTLELILQISEDNGLLYYFSTDPDKIPDFEPVPGRINFCNTNTFAPITTWEMNENEPQFGSYHHNEMRVEAPYVCVLQGYSNAYNWGEHYLSILDFGEVDKTYPRVDLGSFYRMADFEIQDGYAYVLGQGGTLKSIDLATNAIVDAINIPDSNNSSHRHIDIFLDGNKAWLTIYTKNGNSKLVKLDISDPTNMKIEYYKGGFDAIEEILIDNYFCYGVFSSDDQTYNKTYCNVMYKNNFAHDMFLLSFPELDNLGYYMWDFSYYNIGHAFQMDDDGKNLYTFQGDKIIKLEKYIPFEILPQ